MNTKMDPDHTTIEALRQEVESLKTRLAGAEEDRRLQEALESLANFTMENPNPILRLSGEGEVLYANPASEALLFSWTTAGQGSFPEFVKRIARRSLKTNTVERSDEKVGASTYTFVFAPLPEKGYVNLYGMDTTLHKQAEAALRASEARYRQLVETAQEGIWTVDKEGVTTFINQFGSQILGYSYPEMLGRPFVDFLFPQDVPAGKRRLEQRRRGKSEYIEIQMRRKDGNPVWVGSSSSPLFSETGDFIGALEMFVNITERRRHEQAERDSQARLKEYASKLEQSNQELEEFALIASHDLQEPLRKIAAFGWALLGTSAYLDEKQQDYVHRMREAADRMQRMITDLLTLSRVTKNIVPHEQVDLTAVAAEIVLDLDHLIQRTGGRVEVGALPVLAANPVQMRQLFQNLIGNALKFHRAEAPPVVRVTSRPVSPGRVEIQVEDNGIGFDESKAGRIFQPFQRLVGRSDYEGTGMGLAICRKIVERHGGAIRAESAPGQGSTFIVTLPVKRPQED